MEVEWEAVRERQRWLSRRVKRLSAQVTHWVVGWVCSSNVTHVGMDEGLDMTRPLSVQRSVSSKLPGGSDSDIKVTATKRMRPRCTAQHDRGA